MFICGNLAYWDNVVWGSIPQYVIFPCLSDIYCPFAGCHCLNKARNICLRNNNIIMMNLVAPPLFDCCGCVASFIASQGGDSVAIARQCTPQQDQPFQPKVSNHHHHSRVTSRLQAIASGCAPRASKFDSERLSDSILMLLLLGFGPPLRLG